jgi:hypothetical protein
MFICAIEAPSGSRLSSLFSAVKVALKSPAITRILAGTDKVTNGFVFYDVRLSGYISFSYKKDRSTVVYNIAKTTRLNKIPGAVHQSLWITMVWFEHRNYTPQL